MSVKQTSYDFLFYKTIANLPLEPKWVRENFVRMWEALDVIIERDFVLKDSLRNLKIKELRIAKVELSIGHGDCICEYCISYNRFIGILEKRLKELKEANKQ